MVDDVFRIFCSYPGAFRAILCVFFSAGLISVTHCVTGVPVLNKTESNNPTGVMSPQTATDSVEQGSNTHRWTVVTTTKMDTQKNIDSNRTVNSSSRSSEENWNAFLAQRNDRLRLCARFQSQAECRLKELPLPPQNIGISQLRVVVQLFVGVLSVVEVNDARRTIRGKYFMYAVWFDAQLAWDPREYSDNQNVEMSVDALWKPSIYLINSVHEVDVMRQALYVNVSHYGLVVVSGHLLVETSCDMDLKDCPYDRQRCGLVFFTYSPGVHIDIQVAPSVPLTLDDLSISSEWGVSNPQVSSLLLDSYQRFFYFWFETERKTTFYAVCLVLPLVLTSCMNTLVFLLPVQCGEKASFVVTMFVSTSFFFGFLSNVMPKGLDNVPLIMKLLVGIVLQSLLVLLATVFLMRREMTSGDGSDDATSSFEQSSPANARSPSAYVSGDFFSALSPGTVDENKNKADLASTVTHASGEPTLTNATYFMQGPNKRNKDKSRACVSAHVINADMIFFGLNFVAVTIFHLVLWLSI